MCGMESPRGQGNAANDDRRPSEPWYASPSHQVVAELIRVRTTSGNACPEPRHGSPRKGVCHATEYPTSQCQTG